MAGKASARAAFLRHHRHDRAMIAGMVLAIWLAIVAGFGLDLVRRAHRGELGFPLIVHLHAVVYGAWLLVLAAQVWLVRTRRLGTHRRLGRAALVLLPLMLVLGPAAAVVQAANPWMPDRWIAWLSVQFTNAFGSVVLLAAGYLARRDPAAHKRLMLLGTIAVTEPGFGRLWEAPLVARWGDDYLPFYVTTYIGTVVLVAAVGAYDLATRRGLHPAFVGGALWILVTEALATWLFHQPFWLTWMRAMTGHGAH